MKAMIVGKERKKGVSKVSGNPYDYVLVHVTHKSFGVEGLAAETLSVKAADYNPDRIVVGKYCEFDRNSSGFLCNFEMVP